MYNKLIAVYHNKEMLSEKLKKQDWFITIISTILLAISLLLIYSTTINSSSAIQGEGTFPKQLFFVVIGYIAYFAVSFIDISWYRSKGVISIFYVFIVGCLVYVKLFGTTTLGSRRWIDFGFFSFQPSEYAKIVLIIAVAYFLSRNEEFPLKIKKQAAVAKNMFISVLEALQQRLPYLYDYFIAFALLMPVFILTFIQPAFGNSLIILFLWSIITYISIPNQIKAFTGVVVIILLFTAIFTIIKVHLNLDEQLEISYSVSALKLLIGLTAVFISTALAYTLKIKPHFNMLLLLILIGSIFFGIYAWNNHLNPEQKRRITIFIEGPESNPTGDGYQVLQSQIAIGSGQLLGRGYLQGSQSSLNILTQAYTDFVFAALSEQFGLVGSTFVLFLYVLLILRIIKISQNAKSNFAALICIGVATLILLHIFINIGMNLGKLPVTGIPLPLVSYGGSSVLVIMISLGLVQAVSGSQKAVDIADNLMLRSRSLVSDFLHDKK